MRAALIHVAIAGLASFPMIATPATRLVGHGDVDVWNHAWGSWWFWRTLGTGHLPWRTDLLAAPGGGVLWYIDPLGALAAAPFVGILGVTGAYNLVVGVWLALASVAGRSLARAFGASDRASWIGAIATACSPFVLSELHNGISEAFAVQWSVFALAAGWRAVEAPAPRAWAKAGAWLGVAAIGTWYLAFGAATVIACWAILRRRPGVLLAAAVAALLAAPVLATVAASVEDPQSLVLRSELSPDDRELLLARNAVDPRGLVLPLSSGGDPFRHSSYLGLVALGLAIAARRPVVLVAAIPAAILGLGPWLWFDGDWVRVGEARLALPFSAIAWVLPEAAATHAQRVGFAAGAVVGALAAVGGGRWPWVGALVLADVLFASPWPIARAEALDTATHSGLRTGIVLDLPAEVGDTMATSRYLVYQTASGLPIPYRPDARAGTASLLGISSFWVLALPSAHRPGHRDRLQRLVEGIDVVDLAALEQKGVRWVVVHRELERGHQGVEGIERQLAAWYGAPEVRGTHATWDVGGRVGQGRILR